MKQFRLLVAAFAMMLTAPVLAQTDNEYNAALENITDGNTYVISTTFNGTEEGSTTYYLTKDGALTADESSAGEFKFAKAEITNGFKPVGWKINNFSNPKGGRDSWNNDLGHLSTDVQGRNTYEAQVFFLNENGKYAVRATNASGEAWGANTFWTTIATDGDLPNAGYNLNADGTSAGVAYVWNVTDVTLKNAKGGYEALKAKMQALETQDYTDENGAKDAFDAAIAEQDAAVEAATTVAEINAAIAALKTAASTFIQSVTLPNGNSFDVTELFITNPTPTSNADGWTVSADPSFNSANNVAEFWNKSAASISQSVSLPKGVYTLTGVALTRIGMTATLAIGDSTASISTVDRSTANNLTAAGKWFDAGNGATTIIYYANEQQDVTISLTADATNNDYWMVWRSFSLRYFGSSLTAPYLPELADAVTAAEAINGTVPSGVYDDLKAVVDENNKTYETVEEIKAAIANIQTATATAAAFQAPYAAFQTAVAKAKDDVAKDYTDETDAKSALNSEVSDQTNAVDAATTVEDIEAATAAVTAARKTFVYAVTPKNGSSFDVTDFFITNPTPTTNADGWTVNGQVEHFEGATTNVAEFWNRAGASISQTLPNVPAGLYDLTAIALTRTDMTATLAANDQSIAIATVGRNVADNTTGASNWFNAGNGVNTVGFNLDAAQDVNISLTADATTDDYWMVWRSFTLNYYGNMANLNEEIADLEKQFNQLNTDADNDLIPAGSFKNADAAIESLRGATTASGTIALTKALKENISKLNALKDPYAHYKEVRTAMVAISDQTVTYTDETDAKKAFTDIVAAQDTIVYSAADSATIADATTAVENALKTFISTVKVTEGSFDITAFVNNATPVTSLDGWTTDNTAWKNEPGRNVCEYWNETFDFNQTLANLPVGSYQLTMKGFVRQGADHIDLYANADSIALVQVSSNEVNNQTGADPWLDIEENGVNNVYTALTEAGDVKIGVRNAHTMGDGWTIWRSFTLKYLGNDPTLVDKYHAQQALAAAKKVLDETISSAETLSADSANAGEGLFLTPKVAYTTLASAVAPAQAVADNTEATLEEITAATETLNAAIAAFKAAQQRPGEGKTYRVSLKANPDLALTAAGVGNGNAKITAAGSKIAFEPTDGGYYIKADSLYIGNAGTNGWTMSATAEPKTVYSIAYVGDGFYTFNSNLGSIGLDSSDEGAICYGDKTQAKVGDRALWAITENASESKMTIKLAVNRTVGQGETAQNVDVDAMDLANVIGFLGVGNTPDATVLGINTTTGEYVENAMTTYEGWRNKSGDFVTKDNGAFVCVKYEPSISQPATFVISDMPGVPAEGDSVITKWALKNGEKVVEFDITVKFVAPEVLYAESMEKTGEEAVTLTSQDPTNTENVFAGRVDLNAGFTALDDFMGSIYGIAAKEEGKTSLTNNYTSEPAPGFWFNNGIVDQQANGQVGVSIMGIADPSMMWPMPVALNGWTKTALTENTTVQLYLVNSEKTKYYVYNVTLSAIATGITDVNASKTDITGNIYTLDGKLVRQNATSTKGLAKGMYINNGKKFVVK